MVKPKKDKSLLLIDDNFDKREYLDQVNNFLKISIKEYLKIKYKSLKVK